MGETSQGPQTKTEVLYMTMAKQLKILLRRDDITVARLSRKIGVSSKTLYHYLEGRNPRNLSHVKKICEHFKVSSDYLLFGVEMIQVTNESLVPFGLYDVYLKKRSEP